jgi:general secretion pathway protein E
LDLGIEPYLVASSVVAVLAQRLVRKVCQQCASPVSDFAAELNRLGVSAEAMSAGGIVHGLGCAACRQTGFRGRIGIFELLVINEPIRREIQAQANAVDIRSVAVGQGMRLLRDDGVVKLLDRVTTVDEVVRVTMRTAL